MDPTPSAAGVNRLRRILFKLVERFTPDETAIMVILAVLGYLPGLAIVYWLYGKAAAATNLPLYITQERAITVFLMTLAMCAISAMMAVRKVRRLDPAEVF